jgi:hypothetical protein
MNWLSAPWEFYVGFVVLFVACLNWIYVMIRRDQARDRAAAARDVSRLAAERAIVEIAEMMRLLLRERGIEPPKRPDDPSKPSS